MKPRFSKTPTKPAGNKYEGITYECGASGYRLDCAGLVCRRCKDAKIVKMSNKAIVNEIDMILDDYTDIEDYSAEHAINEISHLLMMKVRLK